MMNDSRSSRNNSSSSVSLCFELAEPILLHSVRLIRPTDPRTRRLLALNSSRSSHATDSASERRHPDQALTDILLVTHPSPLLCTTLLPRLSWFTPDRTIKTKNLAFVDTWARSASVRPHVLDIPLGLAHWCVAHAAPPHVLDWLATLFSVGEIVSTQSVTQLFATAASEAQALAVLAWWAQRVPIDKLGHAARVRMAVREAARMAFTCVLDWLLVHVPLARFDTVLDGALEDTATDPVRVIEWWIQQRTTVNVQASMEQWLRQGQKTVVLLEGCTFMDAVSARGCIPILEWWRASLYSSPTASKLDSLEYTHRAIDTASEAGKLAVLNWWKSQPPSLQLKYSELAMDKAPSTAVLDWWLHTSQLPLKFSSYAMTHAARSSRDTSILDWWLANHKQLGVEYSPTTLHDAMDLSLQTSRGAFHRLDSVQQFVTMTWFAKHWQATGQAISQGFLVRASMDPNRAWFLKWWSDHHLPVVGVITQARQYALLKEWWDIVGWWDAQGQEPTLDQASRHDLHPAVVRHEKECLEVVQSMLQELRLAADAGVSLD